MRNAVHGNVFLYFMGCKLISKNFKFPKTFFVVALSSYWKRFLRSSGAAALLVFLPPSTLTSTHGLVIYPLYLVHSNQFHLKS